MWQPWLMTKGSFILGKNLQSGFSKLQTLLMPRQLDLISPQNNLSALRRLLTWDLRVHMLTSLDLHLYNLTPSHSISTSPHLLAPYLGWLSIILVGLRPLQTYSLVEQLGGRRGKTCSLLQVTRLSDDKVFRSRWNGSLMWIKYQVLCPLAKILM